MRFTLGIKLVDKLHLAFLLAGGVNIDDYTDQPCDYTIHYSSDGDDLRNGYTKVKRLRENGHGFFDLVVGLRLLNDDGKISILENLSMYQTFKFIINGNRGLSWYQGTEQTTYKNFNDQNKMYSEEDYEKYYEFFGFENKGGILSCIDLHEHAVSMSFLNKAEFGFGFGYKLGTRIYQNYSEIDEKKYDNVSAESAGSAGSAGSSFQKNDFINSKTLYTFNSYLYGNGHIPLYLLLKPVKSVEMKIAYQPFLEFKYVDYTSKKTIDEKIQGVNYPDKNINAVYTQYYIRMRHNVGVRFRFIFPKIVRLSLGGKYEVVHYLQNTIFNRNSSNRNLYIRLNDNSLSNTQNNRIREINNTYMDLRHTVHPFFELDFEIVKDIAFITLGWNPKVSISTFNFEPDESSYIGPGRIETYDYNVLNLANWKLECVIKFNKKSIAGKNKQAELQM